MQPQSNKVFSEMFYVHSLARISLEHTAKEAGNGIGVWRRQLRQVGGVAFLEEIIACDGLVEQAAACPHIARSGHGPFAVDR
eukprot:scaffold7878_cov126-Isochrysis_galbana.AAC.15